MADFSDIERKQAEAARFAMKMVDEKDPKTLLEMAEQLLERTRALEKMARGLEASLTPIGGASGNTTVVLTAAQKERITEQTGVGLDTVTLADTPEKKWSREMPTTEPREVEKQAARQAAASRLRSETRTQVEKIVRELKKLEVPELADTIRELEADPTLGLGKK